MRLVLSGSGASRGMALGRARLEQPRRYPVDDSRLQANEVDTELERLELALTEARNDLQRVRDGLRGPLAREVGEFIDAHSLILQDPEFIAGLRDLIRIGRYRANAALKLQRDSLVAVFEAMDDAYLRSRREDIEHVIGRVQNALNRESSVEERKLAGRVGEILVSDTVAPSEMLPLAENGALGVVLSAGSMLSHSAILARSLRLPMVVGVHSVLEHVQDGDLILIDGELGELIVHPAAQDLARYRTWQRELAQQGKRLALLRHVPTRTRDGVSIQLFANAEMAVDIASARALGAAGIGLYRTEFLFLQRKELPDEDEQFATYRDLIVSMAGLPVTIRTLDLGADKVDDSGLVLPAEPNPALGVRGVRLSLRAPQVMRTQLRAILRACAYGPIRILLPMVSCVEEVLSVRKLLAECARELAAEGQAPAEHTGLGAMIEVPAAAIALPGMIRHLDFVSIGTNDLIQYTLAADRNNDDLGSLYDPLHPAILKLVAQTIAVCRRSKRHVSVCGEMAGDIRYTPLLIALGLTDFSMHPDRVLEVREVINSLDHGILRGHARALLRAHSRDSILRALKRMDASSASTDPT